MGDTKTNESPTCPAFDDGCTAGGVVDSCGTRDCPLRYATERLIQVVKERRCEHAWVSTEWGSAVCGKCEGRPSYSTWYCPDSPDHLCHYDNGDWDQCDYCGDPEERK